MMRIWPSALLLISSIALTETPANGEKKGFWWYETPSLQKELSEEESRELRPLPSVRALSELQRWPRKIGQRYKWNPSLI